MDGTGSPPDDHRRAERPPILFRSLRIGHFGGPGDISQRFLQFTNHLRCRYEIPLIRSKFLSKAFFLYLAQRKMLYLNFHGLGFGGEVDQAASYSLWVHSGQPPEAGEGQAARYSPRALTDKKEF